MNAITMLESDHRKVETLFTQLKSEKDLLQRRALAEQVITELTLHTEMEETHFYPAAAKATPGSGELTAEAEKEHAEVKQVIAELERMQPEDAAYAGTMEKLEQLVQHHVEEEEGELFPKVAEALGSERLESIGAAMEELKKASLPR
jgi:hemerythrin superfamily protein